MKSARVLGAVIWVLTLNAATARADSGSRQQIDLSGDSWRLWLDKEATWADDRLLLPPVDLSKLSPVPPTGGWEKLGEQNPAVAVPGTVEEYFWDELGDYVGVSWWWRSFTPPATVPGQRIILQFEAVRLRAEVFLNRELVGYDAVGNTPFEVDITRHLKAGQPNTLAVRVTDPSGNFEWADWYVQKWGKQAIPASHGFGGVTGPVRMLVVPPVYVDDIFVKNKPVPTDVDIEITVRNTTEAETQRELRVQIIETGEQGLVVFEQTWPAEAFPPGERVITRTLSVPKAKLWNLESPNLYYCRVALVGADQKDQRFGFRWFSLDGIGQDAVFRLNGRRIVLRTAISWGFWPINGIFPTPELAEKQIRAAKSLGQNMLNFHRCIGQPLSFDRADELGLLIYEEPGGYFGRNGDELCFAFAREKILRMVKRDRSRPSLVIYNMINEEQTPPLERHKKDMADAHRLDPTRTITYTSGWAKEGDDPCKLHMRPYDDKQYVRGWWDTHNACGPGVYRDQFYQGPENFVRHIANKQEIVYWGEDGANAGPPRLELINQALQGQRNGWDGKDYREWYAAYQRYLDGKNLRKYFPSIDELTQNLSNIQYYYQGRVIENIRAGNVVDGYAVNGWECEKQENHSGVVDCFRNLKGHGELIARYNAPLYVAVKLRNKVAQFPIAPKVDFFIVNEADLRGEYQLVAVLKGPDGAVVWTKTFPVKITGGETYGEPLVTDVALPSISGSGRYWLDAILTDPPAKPGEAAKPPREIARGNDELFLVDWKSATLPGNGAILDNGDHLRQFLKKEKGVELPAFRPELPPLDYLLVGTYDVIPQALIPGEQLVTADGQPGFRGEYFKGGRFDECVLKRNDPRIDFRYGEEAPNPQVGKAPYSMRWQGHLKAPESGTYLFSTQSDDGTRLWIDGQCVLDQWNSRVERLDLGRPIVLTAGREYDLKLEYYFATGDAVVRLLWSTPSMIAGTDGLLDELQRRLREDGTTLLVLTQTDAWAQRLALRDLIKYEGCIEHGRWWLGGNYFVREHPCFEGLPVNQAMNWEYQELVEYERRRCGLLLDGEEAIVGSVTGHVPKVATALGVLPCGQGRIVLSSLDILPVLNAPAGPADVVRKVFCNYLQHFGQKRKQPPPASPNN